MGAQGRHGFVNGGGILFQRINHTVLAVGFVIIPLCGKGHGIMLFGFNKLVVQFGRFGKMFGGVFIIFFLFVH